PALRHVQTLDQFGERALARSRRTHDANRLSCWHVETDVVQDSRPIDAIAKGDMLEPDISADRGQSRARRHIGRLGSRVEDVTQPGDRETRLMKILPDLRETQHRRVDPASQNVEGHKLADRQGSIDNQPGAEIQQSGGDDFADELNHLARRIAEAQDLKAGAYVAGELLLPTALHLRLDCHRLERLNPGNAFDEKGLVL